MTIHYSNGPENLYLPGSVAITGGTLDGTVIGGSVPAAAHFTTSNANTPSAGNNSTSLATTAFVVASFAPLASPALTGAPTAPTVGSSADSSTKLATTAFVQAVVASSVSGVSSIITLTGAVTLPQLVTAGVAPLASPILTGTPTTSTASTSDSTGQIASTAYVKNNLANYLATSVATSTYAPLASPALTGAPTAPTAVATDNSTKVATTAYVKGQISPASWPMQWTGGAIVTNGTYYFVVFAPYSGTITSMDWFTANGSFTANVQINGVSVSNLSAVNVNTATQTNTSASGNNTFVAGSAITLIITSATSSPTNAIVSLRIART
jgi:hypothetical protein